MRKNRRPADDSINPHHHNRARNAARRPMATLAVLMAALTVSPAAGQTEVGGPILTNTVWTTAGSPYIVTNAIIIGASATLTIEPGVTVRFNAGLGITVGSQAWGPGTLVAIGTPDQRILFTSNINPGQPGQWKDILFTDFAVDAVFDFDDKYVAGSILEHCVIRYAGSGDAASGAVTISLSAPLVDSCEIHQNARSGIYADNTPFLRIRNSYIHNNTVTTGTAAGASLHANGLIFTGNRISSNTATTLDGTGGLSVTSGGTNTYTIMGNTVTDCIAAASRRAGGMNLFLNSGNSTYTISENTIARNIANINQSISVGGIGVDARAPNSTYTIIDNNIFDNIGSGGGGRLIASASNNTISIIGNTISRNAGSSGGGLYVEKGSGGTHTILIQSNTIIANSATTSGGGLYAARTGSSSLQLDISENTIAGNSAGRATGSGDSAGGGLYTWNNSSSSGNLTVTLTANTVTGNVASGGPAGGVGRGGGMYVTEGQSGYTTTIDLAGDSDTNSFNVLSDNIADFGEAIYNNMLFAADGSNDILAGYVCWGGLDPNPNVNPNLIYDFFDDATKSFVLYFPHVTDPACVATPGCPPGEIPDCNGNCAPLSWLGDGLCDDGRYSYYGVPIHFDCSEYNNDAGDCDAPSPPIEDPPNHDEPETPPAYDDEPDPPDPGKRKLIYIAHGWNTTQEDFDDFWWPMRNAIRDAVGPESEWTVLAYNWTSDSQAPLADEALFWATVHGHHLGVSIRQLEGIDHVHLIAHSAGSALITAAAYQIRQFSNKTVHTTYLDAYAGTFLIGGDAVGYKQAYGGWSDWSDHYFSREREPTTWWCYPPISDWPTGSYTQLHLPNSFNLDVSRTDPDYGPICWSTHTWPICFYHHTVGSGASLAGCEEPSGNTLSYGWPLSYAAFGGDVESWIANMNAWYPRGAKFVLSGGRALAGEAEQTPPVFQVRDDPPIDLLGVPSFASSPQAVVVDSGGFTATTAPDGTAAWVNFQITTEAPINFIRFDVEFLSDPPAAGLVALYVNGSQRRGVVDEPYTLPGPGAYAMPTPGELAPGQHIVSFRLDQFGDVPSTVRIENVATGLGKFVHGQDPAGAAEIDTCPADIDGDGVVGLGDLSILLTNFGTIGGATHAMGDINGDGNVDLADLSLLLEAFGTVCE